jgi:glycosyltransferase involved in cell wall biosynthesis
MTKGEIYTGNLDLIVTHYKEPWSLGKKFFDMLAIQRNINFDDVSVILVNDGEENELPAECFEDYPYEIHQLSIPHGGVSKARNAGLDASTADWVMFCDFDDMFLSALSLQLIFCGIAEDKWDLLRATFNEETKDNQGVMHIVSHEDDSVFVHGKVMRRQFLLDNDIRFHEKLTIHEDGFFNVLTYALAGERKETIKSPVYLWAWNGDSVVRRDRDDTYILSTYDHLIRQRIALTEEFIRRHMAEETMLTIVKTVIDCYYDFQQHAWRLPKNKPRMERAERWFAAYLKRYAAYYAKANVKQVSEIAAVSRGRVIMQKTMLMESETLRDWLEHIMQDVRPIPESEQNV